VKTLGPSQEEEGEGHCGTVARNKNTRTLGTAHDCPRYPHMAGCASKGPSTVGDVANRSAEPPHREFPMMGCARSQRKEAEGFDRAEKKASSSFALSHHQSKTRIPCAYPAQHATSTLHNYHARRMTQQRVRDRKITRERDTQGQHPDVTVWATLRSIQNILDNKPN